MDPVAGTAPGEDEIVKELVTPDIPRVDAVDGPAHGAGFLVVKSQEAPEDVEDVEKAIHGGAAVGSPGGGSTPSGGPDETDDGTNEENSDSRDKGMVNETADAAADGATGTAPGNVSGKPVRKELDFTGVAEALFGVRKALTDLGAPAEVIDAIDNVGAELDNVAKANTGMEAGLDADGDDDGDNSDDTDASSRAKDDDSKQVKKSLEPEVITTEELTKSLTPVFKSIVENALSERLEPLEKRLKTVEEQPQSGGPLLNGAASLPDSDYYVVAKGGVRPAVSGTEPVEVLEKALETVTDPYLRERMQQEIARRMHPTHVNG